MADLVHGRTETLGGHLWPCEPCGQAHDVDHAGRHRRGPTCPRQDTEAWLAARRQARLPVPSVHLVCTGPHALGEISRPPQQDLDDILIRAAAQALITLAADPHDVGGLMGVLCVRHPWTRTLADQPHVHGLVPAGGVAADRTAWRLARTSSLVPVQALSQRCRGRLLALVRQERPDRTLPEAVWTTGWVVSGTPTVPGTEPVLPYLGRDVHRSALTNHRRLSMADGQVGCRDQDSPSSRGHTMTLPAQACIRRCLPHVWPPGFHTVRYDGLWSPVQRPRLHQRQLALAGHAPVPPPTAPARESPPPDCWCPPLRAGQPCPHGGQGVLVVMRALPRPPQGPP
jgi:Putative transposase/Transposase zinc-binding domain